MRRREFIAAFGGATASALSGTGVAQQAATFPTIGFLCTSSREDGAFRVAPFLQGLRETGYVDDRNVKIEYRWGNQDFNRMKVLAADLVHRDVAVLIAIPDVRAVLIAEDATKSIPIIFFVGTDPVAAGLVANLGHPIGNLTGAAVNATEVGPKLMEILYDVVPTATAFACIVNPEGGVFAKEVDLLQTAGRKLGLEIHVLHASTEQDFESVFAKLASLRPGGIVFGSHSLFFSRANQLAMLATRYHLPAIHQRPEFAQAGGLISYGADSDEMFRVVGSYAGRVLSGEKLSNLPVQRPTKFNLIINLVTAKTLGISFSPDILAIADKVIE